MSPTGCAVMAGPDLSFSNAIGLPDALVGPIESAIVCEYASIKRDGTPITTALSPVPGLSGYTIDVNTGLTYPWKAERARANPKVCLLFSEPDAMDGATPPVILVFGQATVLDADLQANTDRYVDTILARSRLFARAPEFMLRWMVGYVARIWIAVTPVKVLWWPFGDTTKPPRRWDAPAGVEVPPSDPPPTRRAARYAPLVQSVMNWHEPMEHALDKLGEPVLTVVDEDGYPVPFRVEAGAQDATGVHLRLPTQMPAKAEGRACLVFHTLRLRKHEMIGNENLAFVGALSTSGDEAVFQTERLLPSISFKLGPKGIISLVSAIRAMKLRLEQEASRRGQPVPRVRIQH